MICYNPKAPTHRYTLTIQAGSSLVVMVNHDFYNPNVPQSVIFDACKAMDQGSSECGSLAWRRTYSYNEKYLCPRHPNQHDVCGRGYYCSEWKCVIVQSRGLTVRPETISKNEQHRILYITRLQPNTTCFQHDCNLVNFTFPNPNNWLKKQTWKGTDDWYGFGIDGTGSDPMISLKIQIIAHAIDPATQSLFHSYYQEVQQLQHFEIPPKARNLFLTLAETIAKQLMVKSCFVCGGTNMGERWPWEAQELNYSYVYETRDNYTFHQTGEETWAITTNLVGKVCYTRNRTLTHSLNVGSLRCLGSWENGTWWSGENHTAPTRMLELISNMTFLSTPEDDLVWYSPDGLYWVCGQLAYNRLPPNWYGSCVLATIRPSFFLLPLRQRQYLGVPVYDSAGRARIKRRIDTKTVHRIPEQTIGGTKWDPETLVKYYGPATWAEDGMYGYRTPIYMLNRIIRLQAVLEIITNETVLAMKHLASQSVKSRTYIMQNRLALDYLLAKEGGVCGKFNLSNCCIEIDDSGQVIAEVSDKMVRLAHVPVQTWKGIDMDSLFGSWFPKLPGLQAIVALMGMIALGCIVLPCVLPIFVKTISNTFSLIAEKRAITQVMTLWEQHGYVPLPTEESDLIKSSYLHIDSDNEEDLSPDSLDCRSLWTMEGGESEDLPLSIDIELA